MPGSGAIARKRAAVMDANRWVAYAIASGDHVNPFPHTDRRHGIYITKLAHARAVEMRFDDVAAAYERGGLQQTKRDIERPPLLTWAELISAV